MSEPTAFFGAFERLVAFRYLRARREEGFVSVIAVFSLLGIMLGVGTLIVVMSVFNGFSAEFLTQVLAFEGDLSVRSREAPAVTGFEALAASLRQVPGVTSAT
ncbi:MAG: lipoprotein-releasing system transmembrane subunit LolC, partial [Aliidongia sp.]